MTTNGRVHAAVFSQSGNTLYLANEGANELVAIDPYNGAVFWRMSIPSIHELAVTSDEKTAFVTRRSANRLAMVDLDAHSFVDVVTLGLPDTLRLSANEKLLTVGLRTSPAQMAVVDTDTLAFDLVSLSAPGQTTTIAGHQWTSPSGRYTFASFEGGTNPGVAVIDHRAGNQVVQRLGYPGRPHGVDFARP
jgi:DNA-binding beta-propeller fold protein YncE